MPGGELPSVRRRPCVVEHANRDAGEGRETRAQARTAYSTDAQMRPGSTRKNREREEWGIWGPEGDVLETRKSHKRNQWRLRGPAMPSVGEGGRPERRRERAAEPPRWSLRPRVVRRRRCSAVRAGEGERKRRLMPTSSPLVACVHSFSLAKLALTRVDRRIEVQAAALLS